jgi:hypothetical protein
MAEGGGNAGEGEGGCVFDEIGNLVEPTERPHVDVRAGLVKPRTASCAPEIGGDLGEHGVQRTD